jgi:hypothetical protein
MPTPTLAIWGALLGWILMPRIRRRRSLRALRPIMSYVIAMVVAVAVMYYFDYHRQSWQFFLGMVVQFAVFAAAAWLRLLFVRAGRR